MGELTITFQIGDDKMPPIFIKTNEINLLNNQDKVKYPYAGDLFEGLTLHSKDNPNIIIELSGELSSIHDEIPINIFSNFVTFYNTWLSRRRKYVLEYTEFFDMNLDHLDSMRTPFFKLSDIEKRAYLSLSNRFGQELLFNMLSRLFAESLRGLSVEESAKKLGIRQELTKEEALQVKTHLFNGTNIPAYLMEY